MSDDAETRDPAGEAVDTTVDGDGEQSANDGLQRFTFPELDMRGELARLARTWTETVEGHDYPLPVQRLLGELLTATALLANTIKISGTLTVQASGDGPLAVLMAECTNRTTLRGIARLREDVDSGAFDGGGAEDDVPMGTELLGSGLITITIRPEDGEPYQGIVPLTGATIAEAIETYFDRSEQIPTRLWLSAAAGQAAGLLVQALPPEMARLDHGEARREEDFSRLSILADTLGPRELRETDNETLLHRLFHEETVELRPAQSLAFRCTCSRERTRDALRTLPRAELETILAEDGELALDCQFCRTVYRFDAIDAELVFRAVPEATPDDDEGPPAH